jgi:predicted component of type VI protein secretion system
MATSLLRLFQRRHRQPISDRARPARQVTMVLEALEPRLSLSVLTVTVTNYSDCPMQPTTQTSYV